jgi:gamma-glutamyltranspeptidase/glutathione hydrolase
MAGIDPKHATPSSEIKAGLQLKESEHTTHFSVVDASGMAVANTYTLNGGFGARVVVPGTGVILNNEMDDFTSKVGSPNMFGLVQGPQNSIEPGKRMLSSMTPTIVVKDGKLRAVVGSPGGPTITTTVAQIVMQLIDHGRSLQQAVAATRVHHQWLPDQIWHEASLPANTMTRAAGPRAQAC